MDQVEAYDRLLQAVAGRASELVGYSIVGHWPHVGSRYRGLVILGQAVYGWADDYLAGDFVTPAGRAEAIAAYQRQVAKPEPLDWIETHPVRSSPFWRVARQVVEALEPDAGAPWSSRLAWINLFPLAPGDPPGNPAGPLYEAQAGEIATVLDANLRAIEARIVIALVGPFWWPVADANHLEQLEDRERPLLRAGVVDGRTWVVGWHPGGASRRGWGPSRYAQILIDQATAISEKRDHS